MLSREAEEAQEPVAEVHSGQAVVEELVNRLKRIEGQARGVQRMLEESRDCEEVILQLAAMRAALSRVAMSLMSNHFRECMAREDEREREEALQRAARVFLRFS